VRIQVSRVDLDGRKIDFRLIQDGDGLVSRAMADKGAGRDARVRMGKGDRADAPDVTRSSSSKDEPRKRAAGKSAKASKSSDKAAVSQKKTPRKRR
jgi:ribonuclease R